MPEVKHVVLLRLKPTTTKEAIAEIFEGLDDLVVVGAHARAQAQFVVADLAAEAHVAASRGKNHRRQEKALHAP